MSIRFRLTLLYSAIVALTLIFFSSILYFTQDRTTYDGIKTNLVRQASFTVNTSAHPRAPREEPPPSDSAPSLSQSPFNLPSGTLPGRWTQTLNITGTITGQTYDLSGTSLPLSPKGLQAVQNGSGWFETATVQEQPLLVYSEPFTTTNGTSEIVQVAFPIGQPQQALNSLRLMLLTGSSLATVVAFAIGWVLAGTALGPIKGITHTAQAIGAERDFSRRVQYAGPTDEVGQLAITFNNMLAELESAFRQLEDALDSQHRFVADASHELRTPLTTVRGNVELLRREPPIAAEERAEILADTIDEVERLIRLVNQLLVLARADAGQALRCEPIPVKPLLEDVYRQAKLLAPDTTILCESSPDVLALGDRDALKQVLLILIDNAHVHTAPGTVVELSVRPADGSAAISVRDTGPGIAPDVIPHIFERFYRGNVARSGRGTGLGLAIAKELVEAQNGTLHVESEVGRGSVFTVVLPQTAT